MSERARKADSLLRELGWATAHRTPIAGDMSSRRYARLRCNYESAVLMDADTDQTAFMQMTVWLGEAGLSVPRIIGADPEAGLILLEDLGRMSLKDLLESDPALEKPLFRDCIELLLRIRKQDPPPLHCPTASELVEWTTLADEHYPGTESTRLAAFRAILQDALKEALSLTTSVSLRDFHAENIMWLPERRGIRRLGLLDYQDAFLTHPVYDLVSLLTDARRFVSAELREEMIGIYVARSGDEAVPFNRAFAAFSAQRNLRILGIFARAGRHLSLLPNVYRYFSEALDHEMFSHVRNEVLNAVPFPGDMPS